MVPFLLRILTLFWLKLYHCCWGILTLFRNGTIFVEEFLPFSEMVSSLSINLRLFWNGSIFDEEFWPFSEMVPFLLRNFDPFLKWYLFIEEFWPFFTIFVDEFWPFSEMVQFLFRGILTLLWSEKMVPVLLRGFNFWGVKKVGPHWRDTGVILVRYWRDTGLTDCSTEQYKEYISASDAWCTSNSTTNNSHLPYLVLPLSEQNRYSCVSWEPNLLLGTCTCSLISQQKMYTSTFIQLYLINQYGFFSDCWLKFTWNYFTLY